MIDAKGIKEIIAKVHRLVAETGLYRCGTDEFKAADANLWTYVKAMEKEAGTGLNVGRVVKFGVSDGYARYIITKINKKTVKLEWLDYADRYRSGQVVDGECSRMEVEDNIAWADMLADLGNKVKFQEEVKKTTIAETPVLPVVAAEPE
jgi:hypothetical protein